MWAKVWPRSRYGFVLSLVQEALAELTQENYEKMRAACLQALQFRNELQESDLLDHFLSWLEASWTQQEKYGEQIAFFSQYIERYPRDAGAYSARAAGLWYSGQLQKAVVDYSHVLELKPLDIGSLSGRGQVLAEM